MRDLTTLKHFEPLEKITDILMKKTQNNSSLFFRVLTAYYFSKIASMMRTDIKTHDRGIIPINLYAINLASCVDMDTEYLSPTGWKKIKDYTLGEYILEIDPHSNFEGTFREPKAYINDPSTELAYKVSPTTRTKLSMMVSPNHGVLYGSVSGTGKLSYLTKPASELFNTTACNSKKIYSKFNLNTTSQVNMSDDELRLMVAFIADGNIKPARRLKARIRIKKERKILRLRGLLNDLGITYSEHLDSGQTAFWFNPPILTKEYDWAWKCDAAQLKIITDESIHWDGTLDLRTNNYKFYTCNKASADFMQYAYQATFNTVVSLTQQDRRGETRTVNDKEYSLQSIDYIVAQSNSTCKTPMLGNITREPMPDGRQYCFTTSTGYWLMRKDGHISVTHNSGHGKGLSTNIIEDQVINQFKDIFLDQTFPTISNQHIAKLAIKRATKLQEDPDEMTEKLQKEFENMGTLAFSFDSGTTAAVKQMRHKLLMANAGSVNMEIDEIGSNLLGNTDVLNTFLELYDVGKVKQKLVKNTLENKRTEEISGRTPTNMLLFGTPSKLLDGDKVESEFRVMLEVGYARRCLFGYDKHATKNTSLTPNEVYNMMTDSRAISFLDSISIKLGKLADISNFHTILTMTKDVSLLLIEYRLYCEKKAEAFKDHKEIYKAEMSHRYYKALKLAGTFAFIDGLPEITEDIVYNAIALVEESGEAFKQILARERNYVRLAKYIVDVDREITQVDLVEDLPFYSGGESKKKELMNLAVAYGYKNNIIIKKTFADGVEFFKGESMEVTDINKMRVSYSTDITSGYVGEHAPFNKLHKLVCLLGHHYTAHHFVDGYRSSTNVIQGFNLVIIDIDSGISMEAAQFLLKGYKCFFATTKRHTKDVNRFRIVFPLSHMVKLSSDNYSKFMQNVFNWLPFNVDSQAKDIARKWQSHNGVSAYQDGQLLNAMLFIPQTRKEEEQTKRILDNQSLSNLERWFFLNTDTGNRSNQLIKYALALVDSGYTIENIRNSVMGFNDKLKDPLTEEELNRTIMVSAIKAITKREMSQ